MIDVKTKEPYINIWFGNFYKPAYDNQEFIKYGIDLLKSCGFNSILLDAKAWQDFDDRYEGKEASQYVSMQEYMQEQIREQGLSHVFMALYLNGDNLYPNIRFSPPIYGSSIINIDGTDGKWYRYWSSSAKDSMVKHIKGLMNLYRDNNVEIIVNGERRLPICSMWDPIVAPSFDDEGRQRYQWWLKQKYHDNIEEFNRLYGSEFKSFSELHPKDYWFSEAFPNLVCYSKSDLEDNSSKYQMWIDNMHWKKNELVLFFQDMRKRMKEIEPSFYLCPDLAQWSYFLNIDGSKLSQVGFSELWDTAMRGIDIYEIAEFVDVCHFLTVPVTPLGDSNPYVVSVQHSMMRCMNEGREFLGGIYWGRFLYQHIYEFLTPCEILGSMVGCGIQGYTSYGMCGLDDGGVLHRMEESFLKSLEIANKWVKKVIPLLGKKRRPKVAILFPNAMATYEPMSVEGNIERRYDMLGWYQCCLDGGYEVDMIDINAVEKGVLNKYKILIVSSNRGYKKDANLLAEKELKRRVLDGGILVHGPKDELVENSIRIKGIPHIEDEIIYQEGGLIQGDCFETYEEGEQIASYSRTGKSAVSRTVLGMGRIYSFGFMFGYSYVSKIAPHVPLRQKNNEFYPIPFMKQNILLDILQKYERPILDIYGKNIEIASFSNGYVITNHTSHPYSIRGLKGDRYYQYETEIDLLMPRSTVCVIQN